LRETGVDMGDLSGLLSGNQGFISGTGLAQTRERDNHA
jgi:hypothetical protein